LAGRTEWVSHSAEESVRDEVVLRLAPKLGARPGVSVVRTSDLGSGPTPRRSCSIRSAGRTASPIATPGSARPPPPARSSSSWQTGPSPRSRSPRSPWMPGSRTTTPPGPTRPWTWPRPRSGSGSSRWPRTLPRSRWMRRRTFPASGSCAGWPQTAWCRWTTRFSVGNAYKAQLVDVFVDDTVIPVWSKNHLIKTVARTRSGAKGPCRRPPRQASAEHEPSSISWHLTRPTGKPLDAPPVTWWPRECTRELDARRSWVCLERSDRWPSR
jgi:hypothetical protein